MKKVLLGIVVSMFIFGFTVHNVDSMFESTYATAVTIVGDNDENDRNNNVRNDLNDVRNDINDQRNDINYTRTAANNAADNDMDFGWIGLLGLIGLAGLRRRNEAR
ncbi:WGxxGxxG family protein [Risungbinella massiliensis]|uniref:WGxxGxxG family protein n=1 Tax=Risungbinella massiliensis TaxID=1329796 RepID=UPI00069BD79F|nr:WGxxGxxG family protein [Risungbinella massiliensis]